MKSPEDVRSQLEAICSEPDFIERTGELVRTWHSEAGIGARAMIEGALTFIEEHPDLDLGSPGAIVHRLEQSSLEFYVPLLLASINRKPTLHTLWMLNRVINGQSKGRWKTALVGDMRAVAQRTDVDEKVKMAALRFLETPRL
jgi:hypothetical protein